MLVKVFLLRIWKYKPFRGFELICESLVCCSALEKIILNGYSALGLMYFFTVGEDEVKAWTVGVRYVPLLFSISAVMITSACF